MSSPRGKQRGLCMPDVSLEFLLYAAVALDADVCLVPVLASSDVTQPLQRAVGAEAAAAVDVDVLFDAFLPPECGKYRNGNGCTDDAAAARRLFLLLKHSDRWAHSVVGDVRGGCTSGSGAFTSATPLRWVPQDLQEIEARWSYAVFLGFMAAVLPPLPPLVGDHTAAYLSLADIADFVLGHLSQSTMRTQVWVPCPPTNDGWRQWNRFRTLLGKDVLVVAAHENTCGNGDVKFTGPMCTPSLVRPVLHRPDACCPATWGAGSEGGDSGSRCSLAWLGEDVPALLPPDDGSGSLNDIEGNAPSWPMADPHPATASLWGSIGPMRQSLSEVATAAAEGRRVEAGRDGAASVTACSDAVLLRMLCSGLVGRGAVVFCCVVGDEHLVAHALAETTAAVARAWSVLVRATVAGGDGEAGASSVDDASMLDAVTASYGDTLQIPLQPLGHHLDSAVYATFERDAPKYRQYAAALKLYFNDFKAYSMPEYGSAGATDESIFNDEVDVVVVVLGAGRGPLVTEVLTAATDADVRVHVLAVEKNPAAATFLKMKHRCDPTWRALEGVAGHRVTVLPCDGRALESVVFGDAAPSTCGDGGAKVLDWPLLHAMGSVRCVVSELLGSAGDNELSPECIDATLSALYQIRCRHRQMRAATGAPLAPSADDGIVSIPESYRFLLAPLQSTALVDRLVDATRRGVQLPQAMPSPCRVPDIDRTPASSMSSLAVLHSVLVAHIVRGVLLAAPQVAWTFHHTANRNRPSEPPPHARSATLSFTLPSTKGAACRVDMLAGYFDAVLYTTKAPRSASDHRDVGAQVMLSTVPSTWTHNMFSWFPCVLPLTKAIHLMDDDDDDRSPPFQLQALVRRVCSDQRVHLEWSVSKAPRRADDAYDACTPHLTMVAKAVANEGGWAASIACVQPHIRR